MIAKEIAFDRVEDKKKVRGLGRSHFLRQGI